MFTEKRLTEAYNKAHRKPLDQHSKYVFFSDLHRGDDSVSDEFARNQLLMLHALNYYYDNAYTYVEVGDGDELWEYSDFKHIRSAHEDIFAAMGRFFAADRLILLYGNHNIRLKQKKYVETNYTSYYDQYGQETRPLFPGLVPQEALVLENQGTKQEVFIVHGHQGDLMNDQLWRVSMLALRHFWRYLHIVGFRNPASPARNRDKRHKVEKAHKRWIASNQKMLICGHTHRARFSEPGEAPYFNTGCGIHSRGITGLEISNNKINMVLWHMSADKSGSLQIRRTVVKGPTPIPQYQPS